MNDSVNSKSTKTKLYLRRVCLNWNTHRHTRRSVVKDLHRTSTKTKLSASAVSGVSGRQLLAQQQGDMIQPLFNRLTNSDV